jgi:hypothetical protein
VNLVWGELQIVGMYMMHGEYFTVQERGRTCKGKKKIAGQFKVQEKLCNRYKKIRSMNQRQEERRMTAEVETMFYTVRCPDMALASRYQRLPPQYQP